MTSRSPCQSQPLSDSVTSTSVDTVWQRSEKFKAAILFVNKTFFLKNKKVLKCKFLTNSTGSFFKIAN